MNLRAEPHLHVQCTCTCTCCILTVFPNRGALAPPGGNWASLGGARRCRGELEVHRDMGGEILSGAKCNLLPQNSHINTPFLSFKPNFC